MHGSIKSGALEIDAPVFDRLGTIIRSLHDALRELGHGRPGCGALGQAAVGDLLADLV